MERPENGPPDDTQSVQITAPTTTRVQADAASIHMISGRWVSVALAESLVAELGQDPSPTRSVRLDLSACRGLDPGAGSLIGNAIRRYAQAVPNLLTLILPPPPSSEARRPSVHSDLQVSFFPEDGVFASHMPEGATGTTSASSHGSLFADSRERAEWEFRVLLRSGLGDAIGRHARLILTPDGENVTAQYDAYFTRPRLPSRNFVLLRDVDSTPPKSIESDDFDGFYHTVFTSWMAAATPSDAYVTPEESRAIARVCFEALTNIYKHARATLSTNTTLLSYLALRYYKVLSGETAFTGPLAAYVHELRRVTEVSTAHYFLDVMVNDDGVGVATRYGGDPSISWRSYDDEARVVAAAFEKGRSSDKTVGRGYGFSQMQDATRRLRAFCGIRTGRVLAFYDGLLEDQLSTSHTDAPSTSPLVVGSETTFRSTSGFLFRSIPSGNLPGTLIQLLVPIPRRSRQGNLF